MPNNRTLIMMISTGLIAMLMIALNYQSPVIASHIENNEWQNQPNSIRVQNKPFSGGEDQIPSSTSRNTVNDILSANFAMTCTKLYISGNASIASGYAAIRVWDDTAGTTIIDSYANVGAPPFYTPIGNGGAYVVNLVYHTSQLPGHVIRARVYRALTNTFGSWDGGAFVDHTTTCIGVKNTSVSLFDCRSVIVHGNGYPANGYAAIRLWASNGLTLYDSYVAGYPTYYAPIAADGSYSFEVAFPQQPSGTTLTVRVYRAPAATTGSWDNGAVSDYSDNCLILTPQPTATP